MAEADLSRFVALLETWKVPSAIIKQVTDTPGIKSMQTFGSAILSEEMVLKKLWPTIVHDGASLYTERPIDVGLGGGTRGGYTVQGKD